MVKIEKTEITPRIDSYVAVIKKEGPFFQAPFHYHPELELVYIKESCGKRIIGNSVEHFEAGDMVFLGSNIPHVWLNDEVYYAGNTKLRAKARARVENVRLSLRRRQIMIIQVFLIYRA